MQSEVNCFHRSQFKIFLKIQSLLSPISANGKSTFSRFDSEKQSFFCPHRERDSRMQSEVNCFHRSQFKIFLKIQSLLSPISANGKSTFSRFDSERQSFFLGEWGKGSFVNGFGGG